MGNKKRAPGLWPLYALIVALILCAACEGGTSGSVMGSSERCSHGARSGQCAGSFKTLSGTVGVDVENENITGPVEVAVQAAVESGSLKVWIESSEEEQISATAVPGEPALLGGISEGDWGEFTVYIQAIDGKAEGGSYEIAYRIP